MTESRVDLALGRLEERMGTSHPLRRVPIDLVTHAVAKELGDLEATDAMMERALTLIANRNQC